MATRLADLPPMTPARVLELKEEAAALKRDRGLKHAAALAQIAQREGFPSWERMVARAGGAQAVHDEILEHPTDAMVRRAERRADRIRRFGGAA